MLDLFDNGANGILADQMGLGKTIQVLALFAAFSNLQKVNGPHLVVCPLTTTMNWEIEIKKWLPGSRVCILPGLREKADEVIEDIIIPNNFDIIVTSYEGMTSNMHDTLRKIQFKIAVIDEAHKMKNRFSIFGQECKRIKKDHAILLTGTPLMNNLSEVWSLLHFIMPHLYTDPELFVDYLDEEEKKSDFSKDELVSIIHKCL